jgi:hypothetical protein
MKNPFFASPHDEMFGSESDNKEKQKTKGDTNKSN